MIIIIIMIMIFFIIMIIIIIIMIIIIIIITITTRISHSFQLIFEISLKLFVTSTLKLNILLKYF